MTKEFELKSALLALDKYGYDKQNSSSLEFAKNKQQMQNYIDSLDFSLRRLEILQQAVDAAVLAKKESLIQQQNIQTYKTKLINLSREWSMSYQDVLALMTNVEIHK